MQEIIKLVSDKTGIPAETAKIAVETVIGFLKTKLPAPIAAQLDGILAGGSIAGALGQAGDLAKGLGSMFGK
jgi:hypothetical protein